LEEEEEVVVVVVVEVEADRHRDHVGDEVDHMY
jgi:hypothetical protein